METQIHLIPALCALHNFIHIYDPLDEMDITDEEVQMYLATERSADGELQQGVSVEEVARSLKGGIVLHWKYGLSAVSNATGPTSSGMHIAGPTKWLCNVLFCKYCDILLFSYCRK
jgi:hypothetical protein